MPKRPSERHLALLRTPLKCDLPSSMFSEDEILKLRQYGTWMIGLANREIEPLTPAEEQFVLAARGQKPSAAEYEKLFAKYQLYKKLCPDHDSESAGGTPAGPRPAKKRVQARTEKHPEPQKPQKRRRSGRRESGSTASSKDKERALRDSLERPKKVAEPQLKKLEVPVPQKRRKRSNDPYSELFHKSPPPPPQSAPTEGYGGMIDRYRGDEVVPTPDWIGSEAAWKRMRGGYRRDGK